MGFVSHLKTEINRYASLTHEARRLFLSSFLYEISSPIAFTFTNAFLFGDGNNNALVALYNLGMFVSLPIGFYLNGYLLRHIQFKKLIALGVLLQGLTGLLLFFLPNLSSLSVLIFGMLFGIPMSLYWANRNYLTLAATSDHQRTYYSGLEQVMSTYVGIVVPFVIGLTIHFISRGSSQTVQAYRILALFALLVHVLNGLVLLSMQIKNPPVEKIFLLRVSSEWLKVRILETFLGIENGLEMFIPSLIILTFLGGVQTLGTLTSLSAAIGAVIVYFITSRVKPSQRAPRTLLFVVIKIALTFLYFLFFTKEIAIILILCNPALLQLKWTMQQAQVLKVLDDEEEGDSTNNYAYVSDQELFLNVGRILGIGIFFSLSTYFSQSITLRLMPLVLTVSQLGVAAIVFSLAKHSYRKIV